MARLLGGPLHMGYECTLKLQVTDLVTSGVEIEQTVKADALDRAEICAQRSVRLQTAAGTYAYYIKCAVFRFLGAGCIIYVGQSVKLVHDDVDVVTTYTGGLYRNAFALIQAGGGAELAVAYGAFHAVKQGGDGVNASGVTYKYDLVG